MPVVSNQINLQTSFSKLAVLYYLLKVVKDNEPTTRTQTRNVLFPVARSRLKSTTTPWDPHKADTHARITLEEYGLIKYDPSDAEKFSVSELGNNFLSSFNLNLNPTSEGLFDPEVVSSVDPDDTAYLIWQILCATHIVDAVYDIHPYRVLMALLSRQGLSGFITKREWAHFLVNTSYNRDVKLDLIETGLMGFRTSTVQQDIKSTDRVLGRLKDWNVIGQVPGTTGDEMAFAINNSFNWVVYSNLTKRELAMSVNDVDVIKKLFEAWAQTQPSVRGGNITLPGAQHYSYELEKDVNDPLFSAIPFSNLFQITDPNKFPAVKASIEAVPGFASFDDARGNGYFSRAMKLYERFLNDKIAYMEVKKMISLFPYLAAIRTKPFVLLAGISGTGKSRLVRQLARGCCPEWADAAKTVKHPLYNEQKPGNYEIIPVRPNWHDSTELMGHVTRITADNKPEFVIKPFVRFLAKAMVHKDVPFFLCLDEMNLAPVEQYFAEYLSAVETRKKTANGIVSDVLVNFDLPEIDVKAAVKALMKDWIDVAEDGTVAEKTPNAKAVYDAIVADKGLRIPPNLVVMGTVNMDETTCSFSRKVLDRAMTFELNEVNMDEGLASDNSIPYGSIPAAQAFATDVEGCDFYMANQALCDTVKTYLQSVNAVLEDTPFKFAYRSRNEIMHYCIERTKGGMVSPARALDEVTSMKILSRIEGDDQKLLYVGDNLAYKDKTILDALKGEIAAALKVVNGGTDPTDCTVCAKKLDFMARRLGGGFTNFFV